MGYLCRLLKHKELGLQFLNKTLHRNMRDIDSITPSYRWGNWSLVPSLMELPWWLSGKESACQCRRSRFDPWVGKIPWKGNGNPLYYSCLGNLMDMGIWWVTESNRHWKLKLVHTCSGSRASKTQLRDIWNVTFNRNGNYWLDMGLGEVKIKGDTLMYYFSNWIVEE